jgi:hypothetical protein
MSQNKIQAATIGHEQPSTAFETNIDRNSSAPYTKGNNSSARPISAYPIVSGFRRSQEKKEAAGSEFMSLQP